MCVRPQGRIRTGCMMNHQRQVICDMNYNDIIHPSSAHIASSPTFSFYRYNVSITLNRIPYVNLSYRSSHSKTPTSRLGSFLLPHLTFILHPLTAHRLPSSSLDLASNPTRSRFARLLPSGCLYLLSASLSDLRTQFRQENP